MKPSHVLVLPLLCLSLLLSACGSSDTTTAQASTGVSSTGSAQVQTTACPTENTRSFAKTRFVTDIGLAAGTFHRWIWKPYQEGTFKKGAKGRTLAIAKAIGISALDAKLLKNAGENAKANPTLCRTLAVPLARAIASLETLKGQITGGDLTAIASTEALVSSVFNGAERAGFAVQETTDTSKASN